jgi:phosphatidylglycerol---prolipoprotein diacylglyceryl transferase
VNPELAALGWRLLDRFEIGPLTVSPHGVGIAVGFLAGGTLLARRAERILGVKREQIWNMLMYSIIGVIIGARLAYVIGHWGEFANDLAQIPRVWEGGVSLQGGILGGIVAAIPYGRAHNIAMLPILDAAAPGFPLGIALGRIGDLVIGDHLGTPTNFFLGYKYLGGDQPPDRVLAIGDVVHQTALYDMLIAAAILPIVLRISKRIMPTGHLIAWTAILYAAGRIFTDFARTEVATFFGLRGTQWTSIAFIIVGVTWLLRPRRRVVPSTLQIETQSALAASNEESQATTLDEPRT